jgi:hypothetical protein
MFFSGSAIRLWSASDDAARVAGGEQIAALNGDLDGTVAGTKIMSVFLLVENPMMIDGYEATPEDIALAKQLRHDGIIIKHGEGDDRYSDYVVFPPPKLSQLSAQLSA